MRKAVEKFFWDERSVSPYKLQTEWAIDSIDPDFEGMDVCSMMYRNTYTNKEVFIALHKNNNVWIAEGCMI